jgi:hypothetical protein
VLEFHGRLTTPLSMAVSGLFSLPLLVLHVSRVLDFRFAITCVLPLAILTLGLVVNGVYGGAFRDYGFIAATIFIIGYATIAYESWAAGRESTGRIKKLLIQPAPGTGAENYISNWRTNGGTEWSRSPGHRIQPVGTTRRVVHGSGSIAKRQGAGDTLRKEYDELKKRLNYLPAQPSWDNDSYRISNGIPRLFKSFGGTTDVSAGRVDPLWR